MQQPSSVSPSSGADALLPLKACNAVGCKVASVVDKAKRKSSQFVSSPYIIPKPLVVNGHTSIFQVGGDMAKMGDIAALSLASGGAGGQPIYRIKPGTHAHIVNYVLIDEGSDSLEKAKSGDQEAMRLLLESQRESAASKLNKLIASHRGATFTEPLVAAPTRVVSTGTSSSSGSSHVTTPQIHPDFSIASVVGAVNFAPGAITAPEVPPAPNAAAAAAPAPPASQDQPSDAGVDRLQAEILELRRTVARLEQSTRR
ncbi:hypothetical protein KR009_003370 [Drosophila setifemur]|nr:hypothetical protein KR009_003370 [Drosophila setifemur]